MAFKNPFERVGESQENKQEQVRLHLLQFPIQGAQALIDHMNGGMRAFWLRENPHKWPADKVAESLGEEAAGVAMAHRQQREQLKASLAGAFIREVPIPLSLVQDLPKTTDGVVDERARVLRERELQDLQFELEDGYAVLVTPEGVEITIDQETGRVSVVIPPPPVTMSTRGPRRR